MNDGMRDALAAATARLQHLDTVSANLANTGTVGHRGDRLSFHQLVDGLVHATPAKSDPSQGQVRETHNPLDLALEGNAWFAVETPEGERYTRAGNFTSNAEGELVTLQGFKVMGSGGSGLKVGDGSGVVVTAEGELMGREGSLGKLRLVKFEDAGKLQRAGETLWSIEDETSAESADPKDFKVRGGALELSNVNLVRGMTELITVSRAYESATRVIESYREVDRRTATELGGR